MSDIIERLEKSASLLGAAKGIGNYFNNMTGRNISKLEGMKEKNLRVLQNDDTKKMVGDAFDRKIQHAKVDRNVARAGTAATGIVGGAGLGGYTAYQKSQTPVTSDLRDENQVSQLPKVASKEMQSMETNELLERLEKSAGLGKNIWKATGFDAAKANRAYNKHSEPQNFMKVDPSTAYAKGKGLKHKADKEVKVRDKARDDLILPGVAAAGVGSMIGLSALDAKLEAKARRGNDFEDQKKEASTLMDSLEKTANEAYQTHVADKRINELIFELADKDPSILESVLKGEGLLDRALEMGLFEDPTLGEGALAGGVAGGVVGGMAGGMGGALAGAMDATQPSVGKYLGNIGKWGAGGMAAGAVGLGAVGAAVGGAEGLYRQFNPSDLHMKYHAENPRQGSGSVSNAPAGEDKSASTLLDRLEKTAEEMEPGRQDRRFQLQDEYPELLPGYIDPKQGTATGAAIGAVGGAALGTLGGMGVAHQEADFHNFGADSKKKQMEFTKDWPEHMKRHNYSPEELAHVKPKYLRGAVGGGVVGTLGGAGLGALMGLGTSYGLNQQRLRDQAFQGWVGQQDKSASTLLDRLEKTAEELLMESLEKTALNPIGAIKSVGAKAKDFGMKVKGTNVKAHKELIKENNALPNSLEKAYTGTELHKGLKGAQQATSTARKQLGVGAGIAGVSGIAGASLSDNDQPKIASEEEEMLNGLFKEAAAAILDEVLPEIKQHVDPINRIKF